MVTQATMERIRTPRSPARRNFGETARMTVRLSRAFLAFRSAIHDHAIHVTCVAQNLSNTDVSMLRMTALPPVRPFKGPAISEWEAAGVVGGTSGKVSTLPSSGLSRALSVSHVCPRSLAPGLPSLTLLCCGWLRRRHGVHGEMIRGVLVRSPGKLPFSRFIMVTTALFRHRCATIPPEP